MKRRCVAIHADRLRSFEIEINYDRILTASYDYGLTGFVGASVDLLMRHVRRNVDEVARSSFAAKFQMIPPSHPSPAAHDVEDGFQLAVMVRSGLCVGLDENCAGPQFAGSCSGVGDGGGTSHAGSLGRIRIQVASRNDFDAVLFPVHEVHDNRFPSAVTRYRQLLRTSPSRSSRRSRAFEHNWPTLRPDRVSRLSNQAQRYRRNV